MEPEPEPAGEPFAVVDGRAIQQHNAEEWARVRARFNIPDNILDGFRFATLHPSGGKGGDLLKFHGSYYIIKQVTGSDQETLLKFTHDLVEHVCTGDSLIALVQAVVEGQPRRTNVCLHPNVEIPETP